MKYEFQRTVLGCPIDVKLLRAGNDWLAEIDGGAAPHIGSVSTAYWENGKLQLKTVLLPGHRDDVISESYAKAIAEKTHVSCAVSCGIHYENPGPEGIARIVSAAEEMKQEIVCEILKNVI
ncbi:MAG: hypothetical protein PUC44_07310 [Eubacteriales bacterium]|nr:hypothetical protein [Eubacteriales bacterium]